MWGGHHDRRDGRGLDDEGLRSRGRGFGAGLRAACRAWICSHSARGPRPWPTRPDGATWPWLPGARPRRPATARPPRRPRPSGAAHGGPRTGPGSGSSPGRSRAAPDRAPGVAAVPALRQATGQQPAHQVGDRAAGAQLLGQAPGEAAGPVSTRRGDTAQETAGVLGIVVQGLVFFHRRSPAVPQPRGGVSLVGRLAHGDDRPGRCRPRDPPPRGSWHRARRPRGPVTRVRGAGQRAPGPPRPHPP